MPAGILPVLHHPMYCLSYCPQYTTCRHRWLGSLTSTQAADDVVVGDSIGAQAQFSVIGAPPAAWGFAGSIHAGPLAGVATVQADVA
eukprot:scaffold167184_cov20-Prasinocladus_malaysianus.AAC.2